MENIGAFLMKNGSISVVVLSYLQYTSFSVLSLLVTVGAMQYKTAGRSLISNILLTWVTSC